MEKTAYSSQVCIDFTEDLNALRLPAKTHGRSVHGVEIVKIDAGKVGWELAHYPALAKLDSGSRLFIRGHGAPGYLSLASKREDGVAISVDQLAACLAMNLRDGSLSSPAPRCLKISLLSCYAGCGWSPGKDRHRPYWQDSFGAALHQKLGARGIHSVIHARTVKMSVDEDGRLANRHGSPAFTDARLRELKNRNLRRQGTKVAFFWRDGKQFASSLDLDAGYARKDTESINVDLELRAAEELAKSLGERSECPFFLGACRSLYTVREELQSAPDRHMALSSWLQSVPTPPSSPAPSETDDEPDEDETAYGILLDEVRELADGLKPAGRKAGLYPSEEIQLQGIFGA